MKILFKNTSHSIYPLTPPPTLKVESFKTSHGETVSECWHTAKEETWLNLFESTFYWRSRYQWHSHHCFSLPVPLWCRVESTGQVSRSEAASAAPLPDAHFLHRGCIHPQSFWTDCRYKMEQVIERSHKTSKDFIIVYVFVQKYTALNKDTTYLTST